MAVAAEPTPATQSRLRNMQTLTIDLRVEESAYTQPSLPGTTGKARVFESKKAYEWDIPQPMRERGSTYWRMVGLTWMMPWFVVTVRWHEEQAIQSFLISSDADLLSVLVSMDGTGVLESLACCMPNHSDERFSWSMLELVAVWTGRQPETDVVMPVCVDGIQRHLAGPSMETVVGVKLVELVARVGETVDLRHTSRSRNPQR